MSILKKNIKKYNINIKGGDGLINTINYDELDSESFITNISSDNTIYNTLDFNNFGDIDINIIKKIIDNPVFSVYLCFIENKSILYNIWIHNSCFKKFDVLFETSFLIFASSLKISPKIKCIYKQINDNGDNIYCYLTKNIYGCNVNNYLINTENINQKNELFNNNMISIIYSLHKSITNLHTNGIKHSMLNMDNIFITPKINNYNKFEANINIINYSKAIYYNDNSVSFQYNDIMLRYGFSFIDTKTIEFVKTFCLCDKIYLLLCLYISVTKYSDTSNNKITVERIINDINLCFNNLLSTHDIIYFDEKFIDILCNSFESIILKDSLCIDLLLFFITLSNKSFSIYRDIIDIFLIIFNIEEDSDNTIYNFIYNIHSEIKNNEYNICLFIYLIFKYIEYTGFDKIVLNLQKIVEVNIYNRCYNYQPVQHGNGRSKKKLMPKQTISRKFTKKSELNPDIVYDIELRNLHDVDSYMDVEPRNDVVASDVASDVVSNIEPINNDVVSDVVSNIEPINNDVAPDVVPDVVSNVEPINDVVSNTELSYENNIDPFMESIYYLHFARFKCKYEPLIVYNDYKIKSETSSFFNIFPKTELNACMLSNCKLFLPYIYDLLISKNLVYYIDK